MAQIPRLLQKITPIQWLILGLLMIILLGSTLPGYLIGKWSWSEPPQVVRINRLVNLQKTGLSIPGWKMLLQRTVPLGGGKWSVQVFEVPGHEPFTLLLLPQAYYLNQPIIDWLDINGVERWSTDSEQTLAFTTDTSPPASVQSRFFRAWKQDTSAIVQWYAWPYGGNPSPSQWFWKDQQAQIRRQRVPWVAVCLKIPIDPLSDLKEYKAFALSLAQSIQKALDTQIFQSMNPTIKD